MENKDNLLLDVQHLYTSFFTQNGEVKAVNDVSFHLAKGEIIAIVGESGSGKSVSQMSVMQLVSAPGKIMGGKIFFDGKDVLKYSANSPEMRNIRGAGISMIFQEPMTSLNPVFTIGFQLAKVICVHKHLNKQEAWKAGIKALESVGIPDPEERMNSYPFEISGGMRQRVLIAMAIACESRLIIADEPTTALDVTTQAQVMELLLKIVKDYGTSLIIVTHNLGLVCRYAKRIYVMYAGSILESGTTKDIMLNPKHPYTNGLMQSVPRLDDDRRKNLIPIPGSPPNLSQVSDCCAFAPRCKYASESCRKQKKPELKLIQGSDHYVACYNVGLEEEQHGE
jgi:peptide/nickel transport system ATP-binding protein